MKQSKVTVALWPDVPAIKRFVVDSVANAIAEQATTVKTIREWCDKSEAAARAEPLEDGCSCLFDARMQLIDEVRTLPTSRVPPTPNPLLSAARHPWQGTTSR